MEKIKVLVLEPQVYNGVFWYRTEQFARYARENKLLDVAYLDIRLSEKQLQEVIAKADVFICHLAAPSSYKILSEINISPNKPLIIDIDDYYDEPNPFANLYNAYGTREVRLSDGTWLWKDGVGGFSIEDNRKRLEKMRATLKKATVITTTTFKMKEYIQSATGRDDNIVVIPNCLSKKYFPYLDCKRDDKIVKIGWAGGSSHFEDIYSILPSLKKIMEQYPHVHYYHIGQWFGVVEKWIPKERLHHYGWINADGHGYRQACLNLDIGLCPLTDHVFNQYKSSIKFYEYSATKTATLAYNSLPYNEEIIEGETGYLYETTDEFGKKLEFLILNPLKRRIIAQKAYDWVWKYRNLEEIAKDWVEMIKNLIQVYKKNRLHMGHN